MSDTQWIFAGLVGLCLVLLGSYLWSIREPAPRIPLPEPREEPDGMTEGKRFTIGGVTITTGDCIRVSRDGGVPRARRERVCAFSGDLILRSAAEVKALATGLEEIAKDLDE